MRAYLCYLCLFSFALSAWAQEIFPPTDVQERWDEHVAARAQNVAHPRHLPIMLSHGHKTPKAVLFIHGIFESPHYFRGIIDSLHAAGHNVVALLLPGHWEKDPLAMNHTNPKTWLAEADFGYEIAREMGDQVILAGHSLGGLLLLDQALKRPAEEVSDLVLLSPAIRLKGTVAFAAGFGALTGLNGNMFDGSHPDDFDMPMWLPSAGGKIDSVIKQVLGKNRKATYARVKTPLMLYYSMFDEALEVKEFDKFYQAVGSAKKDQMVFAADSGVHHGNIGKSPRDAYISAPYDYNHQFASLLDRMHRFLGDPLPERHDDGIDTRPEFIRLNYPEGL